MHRIRRYINRCIALLCLLALFGNLQGQTTKTPVEVTKRKALVGPYCLVNQFSTDVGVATRYKNLDYLTDESLDNHATIMGIKVVTALAPILSVKDTENSYKGGTTAGFTLVSTQESNILSLDVIKLFSIATYLNGSLQETVAVKEATAGGLGLNLIQLPGSKGVCVDVSITTTKDFDEVYLMMGGVNLQVLSQISIKYAFVGDPKKVLLTQKGLEAYGKELGKNIRIDMNKCDGMPWIDKTVKAHLIPGDTSALTTVPVLAVAEAFHLQIGTNYQFPAGTEVGFKYFDKSLLSLNAGGNMTIRLYDENNNVVQTELISAGLLGLGVISTGEVFASIVSKVPFYSARLTYGTIAGVKLGATGVYYGFVKEKPAVYHHCPIQPSMSATICENVTTYELRSNPEMKVRWELLSYEPFSNTRAATVEEVKAKVIIGESVNGVAKVTGLTENGKYTFKATAIDCTSEPKCSETITLTKGSQGATSSCGTPVVNEKDQLKYELSTNAYGEPNGSLISISNIKNKTNILDDNCDNYASYVSGLSLAKNMGVIGIKTVDGQPFDLGIKGNKRVGFIVENASTFLNAKLLQYLRIRLYKEGTEVYDKVIDEWNTVDVGLIGADQSQKMRFSIQVPDSIGFDEFQMWTSGLLDLGLNTLRIYYGFMESVDDNCTDPVANSCSTIATTEEIKASLRLEIPLQTVTVAGTMVGADRLLDGDMNTALFYTPAVGVGTGLVLHVKLGRTVDKSKQLGLALDDKTYLLGLGVGSWMTISTLLNGVKQESFTNWNTLGLDVIGYGDRRYLFSHPTKPYDEVTITFAAVAKALSEYKLYGLFFRSDLDGDGLPDCMDPTCCPSILENLATTPHICVDDKVVLHGKTKYNEQTERNFIIKIFKQDDDIDTATPIYDKTFTIEKGTFDLVVWENTVAGKYQLVIYDQNEEGEWLPFTILNFTVHPKETTWLTTTADTNWNTWDNWQEGSPWTCTNVIIPEGAEAYPILNEKEANGCNYIHFKPNAEVKNTHHLDYQKAWVDIRMLPDRYYMVAAPLKRIYSGDWFIAADGKELPKEFTVLDNNSYPENRVTPTIYQRNWDVTYMDQLINTSNRPYIKPGEKVDVTKTGWTKPFNWLSTPYDKNTLDDEEFDFNALSVWVHPFMPTTADKDKKDDTGKAYVFRFPKAHSTYYYYDKNGKRLNVGAQIADRNNSGRFIYEPDGKKATFPIVMYFKNESFQNKTFLVGNPFMTHIDVAKLLEANKHLSSVKTYDTENDTYNSLIHSLDGPGIMQATPDEEDPQLKCIAPMQSFFVTCSAEMVESCAITFTEDMLLTGPESKKGKTTRQTKSDATAAENRSIRLVASADSKHAAALVHFSTKANDHYRENEDAELLLENEVRPAIALFTIADQRALDIQQRQNGGEIPLGIYLERPADVTLSVTVPADYDGWTLNDWDNNRSYPLSAGEKNQIKLGQLTTNVGRFSLRGESMATSNGQIAATQPKVFCYREENGSDVIVRSSEQLMKTCEVFTADGRKAGLMRSESNEYRLPVGPGVYVLKIQFKDQTSAVVKVF